MRIISGSKKGHSIFSHKDKDVRPLSDKNRELQAEADATSMEGGLMIAAAATIMNVMFKFFAAFALVLLTLILYRIEKSLRK